MKLSVSALGVAVCFGFATPGYAQAGPFIDWIHKLSGPEFVGIKASLRHGYRPGQRIPRDEIALLQENVRSLQALAIPADMRRSWMDAFTPLSTLSECSEIAGQLISQLSHGSTYDAPIVDQIRSDLRELNEVLPFTLASLQARTDGRPLGLVIPLTAEESEIRPCRIARHLFELQRDPDNLDSGEGFIPRLGIFAGRDLHTNIWALSVSPTLEYLLPFNIGIESGVALHYFTAGEIEDFWHASFPVRVNWHIVPRHPNRFLRTLRLGVGANIFLPFSATAFSPLYDLENEDTEIVFAFLFGLDLTFYKTR